MCSEDVILVDGIRLEEIELLCCVFTNLGSLDRWVWNYCDQNTYARWQRIILSIPKVLRLYLQGSFAGFSPHDTVFKCATRFLNVCILTRCLPAERTDVILSRRRTSVWIVLSMESQRTGSNSRRDSLRRVSRIFCCTSVLIDTREETVPSWHTLVLLWNCQNGVYNLESMRDINRIHSPLSDPRVLPKKENTQRVRWKRLPVLLRRRWYKKNRHELARLAREVSVWT